MDSTTSPPVDQLVVDQYFQLLADKKFKRIAWLYGMVSTYGLKPDELKYCTWNLNNTININTRKRPVRPLHPQWVSLFQLKKKQPSKTESCWEKTVELFYGFLSLKSTPLNLTDLILAYRMRKKFYKPIRRQQVERQVCSSPS